MESENEDASADEEKDVDTVTRNVSEELDRALEESNGIPGNNGESDKSVTTREEIGPRGWTVKVWGAGKGV